MRMHARERFVCRYWSGGVGHGQEGLSAMEELQMRLYISYVVSCGALYVN